MPCKLTALLEPEVTWGRCMACSVLRQGGRVVFLTATALITFSKMGQGNSCLALRLQGSQPAGWTQQGICLPMMCLVPKLLSVRCLLSHWLPGGCAVSGPLY